MPPQTGTIKTHDLSPSEQRHLFIEKGVIPDQVRMRKYNGSEDGLPDVEQNAFVLFRFQQAHLVDRICHVGFFLLVQQPELELAAQRVIDFLEKPK